MNTFLRFFYAFISIFFEGLFSIFKGIYNGILAMFNFSEYTKIIDSYKESFNGAEWIFVFISVACLVLIVGLIGMLIYFSIKKMIRRRSTRLNQEDLLNEITNLNEQVQRLMKEK